MKCSKILLQTLALLPVGAMCNELPNVVLIMVDDLGWGDVGFNGCNVIQTPNLDALASQGLVFDRFYTGCSVSSPTRASLLTGRNPFRMGVFDANKGILRPEEETLAELMKEKGYATGHFGKWHLGTLTYKEKDANRGSTVNKHLYNVPSEHGYDESFVTESKVPTYDPMIKPENCNNRFWDYVKPGEKSLPYGTHYWLYNNEKETENLSGDDSRIVMDRVIPFIDNAKKQNKPFLSVIWFHTPHLPCVAGPEHAAIYKNYSLEERNYYGCITAMDEQVGRLVEHLKKKGMFDNTIICFCSDNGPEVRTPGTTGGLRGRKRDLYEGGIRVPSFAVWPKQKKLKGRTDYVVSTVDYLPTFVELLNLRKPSYKIDGVSVISDILNNRKREKPLVLCYKNQGSVIEQTYKLYYVNGNYELYNIEEDRSEQNDLSKKYPHILNKLKTILKDNLRSFEDSFNGKEYGTNSVKRMNQKWVDIIK